MGNSVEYISYNCVLFSYSQLLPRTPESGGITVALLRRLFQQGSNGGGQS